MSDMPRSPVREAAHELAEQLYRIWPGEGSLTVHGRTYTHTFLYFPAVPSDHSDIPWDVIHRGGAMFNGDNVSLGEPGTETLLGIASDDISAQFIRDIPALARRLGYTTVPTLMESAHTSLLELARVYKEGLLAAVAQRDAGMITPTREARTL